jgi:hypothetical protein
MYDGGFFGWLGWVGVGLLFAFVSFPSSLSLGLFCLKGIKDGLLLQFA